MEVNRLDSKDDKTNENSFGRKFKQGMKAIIGGIDKVLFPRNIKCLICGRDLFSKQNIEFCEKCKSKLEPIEKCCVRCGAKLVAEEKYCLNCQNNKMEFDIARGVYLFDGELKNLIHNFKYNNKPYIASTLAYCMADFYSTLDWKVDMVLPVPSSRETLKSRGYNQAELLANKFCELVGLELNTEILLKSKHTKQQANLGFSERQKNLADSFSVDLKFRPVLRGKTILLIDDVITTGSTLSECAKILKKRGAKRVLALAVGRAYLDIPVQNDLKNAKSFVN